MDAIDTDPYLWLSHVKNCRYLNETEMNLLCKLLRRRLATLPSLVSISSPVVVCGDIHGQFYDLMRLFETGGNPKCTRYIFLGDYVDRGYYSLETVTLLFLYMYLYPNKMTLLRGNHETRRISALYGFYDECQQKYGHSTVWNSCCRVFDLLPVAALIDDSYFCVHGGLSPNCRQITNFMNVSRNVEVPLTGVVSDLLWSDPDESVEEWAMNQRGAGYRFGEVAVKQFLHENDIELILRSHQLVMEGFKYFFNDTLATVWSAPNYCYRCGNVASIFKITESGEKVVDYFDPVPGQDRSQPKRSVAQYFL